MQGVAHLCLDQEVYTRTSFTARVGQNGAPGQNSAATLRVGTPFCYQPRHFATTRGRRITHVRGLCKQALDIIHSFGLRILYPIINSVVFIEFSVN
jgi:hypothetical protein